MMAKLVGKGTAMHKHMVMVLVALVGSQAQALSCVQPDPVRAFQAAMAAPDAYVVLRGRVSEAEVLIPLPQGKTQDRPVPVWFIGAALTSDGFTQTLEGPMTVQITCAGPWCGSMLGDAEQIFFARLQDGAYTIDSGPCGGAAFAADPRTEALLTSCMRGDACVPDGGLD
jgi:hypothetical protein